MRVIFGKCPFAVVCLDDICVISHTYAEHLVHSKTVFQRLRKEKLYSHMGKFKFALEEFSFLGHAVSGKGLFVENFKTEAIAKWPVSSSVKDLDLIIELSNIHHRIAQICFATKPTCDEGHTLALGKRPRCCICESYVCSPICTCTELT
ncbi:hypothetical protein Plhal304r1_c074g0162141 [Plasmopara halstedii]